MRFSPRWSPPFQEARLKRRRFGGRSRGRAGEAPFMPSRGTLVRSTTRFSILTGNITTMGQYSLLSRGNNAPRKRERHAANESRFDVERPRVVFDRGRSARAGGSDVQLAGSSARRVDVVSSSERVDGAVPAPHAPAVSRVASAHVGTRAVVRSARHVAPTTVAAPSPSQEIAPAQPVAGPPEPQPAVSSAGRPQAPRPSTQREPRGGWSTPGQVIRNAPFPINP